MSRFEEVSPEEIKRIDYGLVGLFNIYISSYLACPRRITVKYDVQTGNECALSLLVFYPVRGVSVGPPVFPSPQRPTFDLS